MSGECLDVTTAFSAGTYAGPNADYDNDVDVEKNLFIEHHLDNNNARTPLATPLDRIFYQNGGNVVGPTIPGGVHAKYKVCTLTGGGGINTVKITQYGYGYRENNAIVFRNKAGEGEGGGVNRALTSVGSFDHGFALELDASGVALLNHPNPAPLPTPGVKTALKEGAWPAGNVTRERVTAGRRPGNDVIAVVPRKGTSFIDWYRWNVPGYAPPKNFDASSL